MTSDTTPRRGTNDRWAVALIVAIPVLLLGRSMLPGNVLATAGVDRLRPWNASATAEELALPQMNFDSIRENLAYRVFLHRSLGRGEIPWWTPYQYGGLPFVGLSHTEVLYPPVWVASLFSPYTTYGALIAFHMMVAGLGMFLCVRAAGLSTAAALVGAVVFMLNGMFVTRHGHPQFIATGAWLPWILLGVHLLLGSRAALGMTVVAAGTALAILAGHPSIYVYGFYFVGAYAVCAALLLRPEVPWRRRFLPLAAFAAAFAVGVGLASTQLLATAELAAFSDRSDRSFEALAGDLPHWSHMVRLLFPDIAGNPLDGDYWSVSRTSYTAGLLYVGILPLLLAVVGIVGGRRRGAVLAALTAAPLLVMYVPPLYRVVHAMAPGFEFSRVDRSSIAFFLGVSLLSALGLEAVRSGRLATRALAVVAAVWAVVGAAGAGLAVWALPVLAAAQRPDAPSVTTPVVWGMLLWAAALGLLLAARSPRPRRWVLVAMVTLVVVDTGLFAGRFVIVRDAQRMLRDTPATRFLQEAEPPFRIVRFGRSGHRGGGPLPANTPVVYGIEDVHGFGPMHMRDLDILLRATEPDMGDDPWHVRPFSNPASLASPVLDLLGARYILTDRPIPVPLRRVHGDDLYIYENPDALPRALFVRDWSVAESPASAAALLASGEVDPRRTALLDRAPAQGPATGASGDNAVELRSRDLTSITVRKTGPDPGLVVLNDPFYPGWTATVDGADSEVLRANVMFRAVAVGSGDHDVVFEYRPTYLTRALMITVAAGVSLLVMAGLALRHRERNSSIHSSASTLGMPSVPPR